MISVVKSWRDKKKFQKYDTSPPSVGQPSKCRKKKNRHKVILNTCVDTYDMPSSCRTIKDILTELLNHTDSDAYIEHIIAALALMSLNTIDPNIIQDVEDLLPTDLEEKKVDTVTRTNQHPLR